MMNPKKIKPAETERRGILSRISRSDFALATILCVAAALVAILAFDPLPSTIGDNAEFAILGQALAHGLGYRYINHPDLRPATKYPPGFPLLLAGWIRIFNEKIVSMKALVLVLFAGSILVAFHISRMLLERWLALLAIGLVVSSWMVVNYSFQVLSDVPYMFFSLLGLLFLLRAETRWEALLGGGISIWAYLTRTVGASLVVMAIVLLLVRRRRLEAGLILISFVAVTVGWALRNYSLTGEGSRYLKLFLTANPVDPSAGRITFDGMLTRVWINFRDYVTFFISASFLPTVVSGWQSARGAVVGLSDLARVVSALIMFVSVVGLYSLRRRAGFVILYMNLYFGVYLVWPEIWRTERFMVPIVPLVAVFFVRGIDRIISYFKVRRAVTRIVMIGLIIANLASLVPFIHRSKGYPPGWYNYLQTALWARDNTPEGSVILCRKPFMYYIFSYRKTVGYPYTRDHEAMRRYLYETNPDYIVIDNFGGGIGSTQVYLVPVLKQMPEAFDIIYRTDEPVNLLLKFNAERG